MAAQLEKIKGDIKQEPVKKAYDKNSIKRGDIYYTNNQRLQENTCVQLGGRPVVIISNDTGNQYSSIVICVPLTTKEKKPLPTHVQINSIENKSTAMCEQIFTIDQNLLSDYMGHVTDEEMQAIDEALNVSIKLTETHDTGIALKKWAAMYQINFSGRMPVVEKYIEHDETVQENTKAAVNTMPCIQSETPDDYLTIKTELQVYKRVYGDIIDMLKTRGI